MADTHITLLDAMQEVIRTDRPLGVGGYAATHPFLHPELEAYVLRVKTHQAPRDHLQTRLKPYARLQPPKLFLRNVEIGQRLLVDDPTQEEPLFSIMRKVPGRSLGQWMQGTPLRTIENLAQFIAHSSFDTGTNPFVNLFEHTYRAVRAGVHLDTDIGNVMYEPGGAMKLIDQPLMRAERPSRREALLQVQAFGEELKLHLGHHDPVLLSDAARACGALIEDALAQLKRKHRQMETPAFGTVDRVESIRLSSAVPEARALLDTLHAQAAGRAVAR